MRGLLEFIDCSSLEMKINYDVTLRSGYFHEVLSSRLDCNCSHLEIMKQ